MTGSNKLQSPEISIEIYIVVVVVFIHNFNIKYIQISETISRHTKDNYVLIILILIIMIIQTYYFNLLSDL